MLVADFSDGSSVMWHIGFKANEIRNNPAVCTMVQADGDELVYVLRHTVNLPHTDQKVQRWYGDLAKLVAGVVRGVDLIN